MSAAKGKPRARRAGLYRVTESACYYVVCRALDLGHDVCLWLQQKKSRIEDRRAAEESDWS